jgi:hypothetical protein
VLLFTLVICYKFEAGSNQFALTLEPDSVCLRLKAVVDSFNTTTKGSIAISPTPNPVLPTFLSLTTHTLINQLRCFTSLQCAVSFSLCSFFSQSSPFIGQVFKFRAHCSLSFSISMRHRSLEFAFLCPPYATTHFPYVMLQKTTFITTKVSFTTMRRRTP